MAVRRVLIGVIAAVLGFLACVPSVTRASESEALRASVILDKQEVTIGDELTVTGMLTNVGTGVLHVPLRRKAYTIYHLTMRDRSGRELRGVEKVWVHLRWYVREDFVRLAPGGQTSLVFNARFYHGGIADTAGAEHPKSLVLDFDNSAILLPGPGTYTLIFEFEQPPELRELALREFGIAEVWHGKITSPPIALTIR